MHSFFYESGIPERHVKLSASIIPTQWGKDSEVSHHWPKGEVSYVFDDKSYGKKLNYKATVPTES